ncbi:MAG: MG2 domain-containing protein [Bacteroidia bacterium]
MESFDLAHQKEEINQKTPQMMTNTPTRKLLKTAALGAVVLSLAWIAPASYYQLTSENDLIRSIKQKLTGYNEQLPEDRVYVHFDKPFYQPGESIWLSAYIREGQNLKASDKSDIVHIELINPKGTIEKKINIIAKNGKASGDFALDKEALGGMYKVRAYTNWMKNEGENNAFEKELQVQAVVLPALKMKLNFERKAFGAGDEVIAKLELNTNENKALGNYDIKFVANLDGQKILEKADVTDEEGIKYIKFNLPKKLSSNDGLLNVMINYNGSTESVSRSIPIVLNTVQFSIFPEGGELVSGLENNIAFRALNEFDKPADVEGIVLTEKGSQVASFSSYHQGMGAFSFNPQPNEKYTVKITKPEGIEQSFPLPEVLQRGYVMNVDNSRKEELLVNVKTTETEELSLVAQVRGKIYYSTVIDAKKGSNKIAFPTANFPVGVSQITLFDSKGIARAERLTFVNKDKQLNISVETEKEKYLPREKVKMTLSVKDERGLPMPANLSLAVVNDQLLSFADDKSGHILSQLLLEQDLKDKVEEPGFYFDKKEEKSDKALDYLLMTAGWRRFTWEKVMDENTPVITYAGEKAVVGGIIYDGSSGKPMPNVKVKIVGGTEIETDANGKFAIKRPDLSNPITLIYNAEGYNQQSHYVQDYNPNLNLYMYKKQYYNYSYGHQKPAYKNRARAANVPQAVPNDEIMLAGGMNGMGNAQGMLMDAEVPGMPQQWEQNKKKEERAEGKAQMNVVNKAKVAEKAAKLDENADEDLKEVQVADRRDDKFKAPLLNNNRELALQANGALYYRARQFAAPVYDKEENVETRTDFRNTIYWNPNVEVGNTGKKTIEFYTSDDITSFRTTVEGISNDGSIGRTEKNFFTQLPFAMTTKIPVEVATEDNVSIPLTLKNNTSAPLGGVITISAPDGLKELVKIPSVQTIMPGKAKTIYLDYKVLDKIGYGEFTISFKACGLGDAFTQRIKIAPKGFPVSTSFSGQNAEKEFSFEMNKVVNGSLRAVFTAYPNVVSDLMKGVEGILREPYGCFEQTSMSSYPNAMVLDYLKSTDSKDDKTILYASNLLDKGYKRLITFETKDKGYEWFGSNPGHEALSAYGLMQFVDMKKAGEDVDQKMVDRTANWLMSKKDGKGGFTRNPLALDNFGRASKEITDAYIVYALSEAGFTDLKKEYEAAYENAMKSKDPYMLGLVACAAYNLKDDKKAGQVMKALLEKQDATGSWPGGTHSITYSQGQSLLIETTSLAIMSILKSPEKDANALAKAVQYLVGSRGGYGTFGNTQGTVLALKALTEYAKFSKKATEDGTVVIYVDGKKAGERSYKAGDKGAIVIEGLEDFVKGEGKHDIKVKYQGAKNPLPYSVAVSWNTTLPVSSKDCVVGLKTKMTSKTANVGETVRLTTTVTNKKNEGLPSTMAIIGIPAGFTVQPWQLKEMQEKKVFDYYEISGNSIAVYYRCMAPNAVKEINLDLKAEMPGEYDAPASSAYLYYTNEFKTWGGADHVTIKKAVL